MARGFYKRGEIGDCDFTENGQRVRKSLRTLTDWREAQRERKQESQARQAKLTAKSYQFAKSPFRVAAEMNLTERLPRLAERSVQTEKERLKPLDQYFGTTSLTSITTDMVRDYVRI